MCGQGIFGESSSEAFADGVGGAFEFHEGHAVWVAERVVAVFSESGQNLIGDPIQDFLWRFRERHGNLGKQDKDFPPSHDGNYENPRRQITCQKEIRKPSPAPGGV